MTCAEKACPWPAVKGGYCRAHWELHYGAWPEGVNQRSDPLATANRFNIFRAPDVRYTKAKLERARRTITLMPKEERPRW